MAGVGAPERLAVTPYFRLLVLRLRRRYASIAFGLPVLAPSCVVVFVLGVDRFSDRGVPVAPTELMEIGCLAALVGSLMVAANLTAFFVHDERANGRSRQLRLATVDGRAPVVALLGLAAALAAASAGIGLGAAGLLAVGGGLPVKLWLGLTLWTAAVATAGGPIGAWLGYLLPRTVAMVAVLATSLWTIALLGPSTAEALETGAPALGAVVYVTLAQIVTLLALPPLWSRTSARLW